MSMVYGECDVMYCSQSLFIVATVLLFLDHLCLLHSLPAPTRQMNTAGPLSF